MDQIDVDRRVRRSQIILAGWMQMGRPTGGLEDILRMIRHEINLLTEIAAQYPEQALVIDDLVKRYREFSDTLKAMTN